jgi:glutathione S-transferase
VTLGIGSYAENQFPPTIGHDHHPRLIDEYPDQWVAVADSAVMAHGDTLEQVLTQIDAQNISRADVIVRFIERTQRTLIL